MNQASDRLRKNEGKKKGGQRDHPKAQRDVRSSHLGRKGPTESQRDTYSSAKRTKPLRKPTNGSIYCSTSTQLMPALKTRGRNGPVTSHYFWVSAPENPRKMGLAIKCSTVRLPVRTSTPAVIPGRSSKAASFGSFILAS